MYETSNNPKGKLMAKPRNGRGRAPKTKKGAARPAKKKSTTATAKRKAAETPEPEPAPLPAPADESVEDILDELLADEPAPADAAPLALGESPDKALQRECIRTLADPSLKPHERLKVIQTLDRVNERLARNATSENVTDSLLAWIRESLGGGPGPMADRGS